MLKLIGFNHIDPNFIADNFVHVAFNEGTIGLVYDVDREFIANNIVDEAVRNAWHATSEADNDLFCEREDELLDLMLHLPTMFNMGITSLHWCHTCKNFSTTVECDCPERRGVTGVEFD